jgi:uncharacterized protein
MRRSASAEPTQPGDRVPLLDILRGFALAGIIVVNITRYNRPAASGLDDAVLWLLRVFAQDSFYPLFALLFGVGFAVFLDRIAARGGNGVALYLRRLVILLLIAVAQYTLLEDRNILVRYAVFALPLLLFSRASARVLLVASFVALAIAAAMPWINSAYDGWRRSDPAVAEAMRQEQAERVAARPAANAEHRAMVQSRSYTAWVKYQARFVPDEIASYFSPTAFSLYQILTMFLLGAAAWRAGVFIDLSRYRPLAIHLLLWAGLVGVLGNIVLETPQLGIRPAGPIRPLSIFGPARLIANVSLSLAYAAGIFALVATNRARWERRLSPIGLVGRMGLTNYLWQSLVMGWLFLPFGFMRDPRPTPAAIIGIGILIYLSHIPISMWWLRRFRFGPVEWLWRTLTYGKLQPIRQVTKAAPTVA